MVEIGTQLVEIGWQITVAVWVAIITLFSISVLAVVVKATAEVIFGRGE